MVAPGLETVALPRRIVIHRPRRAASVTTAMAGLADALVRDGHDVRIVTSYWKGLWSVLTGRRACHVLNLEFMALAPLARISLCWAHGMARPTMSRGRALLIRIFYAIGFSGTGQIVAVSGMLRDELIRVHKVDPARILSVSNGALIPLPLPAGPRPRTIDVVYIGRMTTAKGSDRLARIFGTLRAEGYVCVAYGAPALEQPFYGGALAYPDGVMEAFARSRLFLSLNAFEPYGLTVFEAAQKGTHVLCTPLTGALEDLAPGQYTLLPEDADDDAVIAAIRTRLGQPLSAAGAP